MFIIAEIGWNHMGDMSLAKEMIMAAKKNGADYCKFQTWSVKHLKNGSWDHDGRREIYKKAELTQDKHYELKEFCEKQKIHFLTSIFNINDLEFLKKLNKSCIKIPSHEVYNLELINKTLENFDKVLISTGAAKWEEIKKIFNLKNKEKIVLMHCVSAYPLPPKNVNFPRMLELKKHAKNIGYSGHCDGIEDAIIAFTLGATYVEKHFTIDKNLPGRDNKFAILPPELLNLSKFRESLQDMSQNKGLDLQECEKDIFSNYRGRWSNK